LSAVAVAALFLGVTSGESATNRRVKRFATQSCSSSPETTEDSVVDEGDSVTIQCNFDDRVESCTWTHNEPMNENNQADSFDISCTGNEQLSGQSCNDDTRVQFQQSGTMCGITIQNSEPEDTGLWNLNAIGINPASGTIQTAKYEFEMFTYNRSTNYVINDDDNEVSSVDVTYNWDDRNDDWWGDYTNYENLVLTCGAQGGRPEPTFIWYIENNQNDELNEDSDGSISLSTRTNGQEDSYGYITNMESEIDIRIDQDFMRLLEDAGVDSNPEDGNVRFTITCEIDQGDSALTQYEQVDVRIEREYDSGALAASTIGLIVGLIIGVALLIILVVCLLVARSKKIWCFAENDYQYRGEKHQPRTQHDGARQAAPGGGGHGDPRQQHHSRQQRSPHRR